MKLKPKVWFEFDSTPNSYFCVVDKNKKQVTLGQGTIMPYVYQKINLEEFLIEHVAHFTKEKQIDIEKYVNS